MAGICKLADLREPPVVGQFYLVPVVRNFRYYGIVGDWPVIGPKHRDVDFFNFPHEHYHVDARFLSAAQERVVLSNFYASEIEHAVGKAPLFDLVTALPKGRPQLGRRKCRRATYGHTFGDQPAIRALRKHFGEVVEAIRLDDGRILCPHRKADLTQFPVESDGTVMCPLHGLRVCVSAQATGQ